MSLCDPARQFTRLHCRRPARQRRSLALAEADDLGFQLYLEPGERLGLAETAFADDVGKARIGTQPFEKRLDAGRRTGQEQVDALAGNQDGAAQVQPVQGFAHTRNKAFRSLDFDELVGGNVQDHPAILRHGADTAWPPLVNRCIPR